MKWRGGTYNTLTLRPTLLEGVLVLKLGSHDEGYFAG
jgi:hypothetical protein